PAPPRAGWLVQAHGWDGSIRLVSGADGCQGRVEIFYRGHWGTVCDDDWGLSDAGVVCRQLGCGRAVAAWGEARYGQGAGYIFLDNLKCKGTEASLLRCSHIRWDVHNCDHSEDAGALCTGHCLRLAASPAPPALPSEDRVPRTGCPRRVSPSPLQGDPGTRMAPSLPASSQPHVRPIRKRQDPMTERNRGRILAALVAPGDPMGPP
uniref:Scavenger receptor cysteine rich family member with 4 domains n=1 Tax=Nothoprocta perdicaria TaxID=30464 RepID=A0A8C6YSQ1_NOTPE